MDQFSDRFAKLFAHWQVRVRFLVAVLILLEVAKAPAHEPSRPIRAATGQLAIDLNGLKRPETLNDMRILELQITDSAGKRVENAEIIITGQRRYAPTELPTRPQAFPEGGGTYRVEGLRFHMAGEWSLVFDIRAGQIHDRLAIDVLVK